MFETITPRSALLTLRHILGMMKIEKAELYRTHDLRRGHARDLQKNGMYVKPPSVSVFVALDRYSDWENIGIRTVEAAGLPAIFRLRTSGERSCA